MRLRQSVHRGQDLRVHPQVLFLGPVMERDGSSQSLARKGGRISDALLSFGDFSQIHGKRVPHGLFHISPLTTVQQSEEWRLLGKRAHLRAAMTTSSLWTPLPIDHSAAGANKAPATEISLRKCHIPSPALLLCHLDIWHCTPQLGSTLTPLPWGTGHGTINPFIEGCYRGKPAPF